MANSNLKSDPRSVKLADIGSDILNPSTEEKQDTIISALGYLGFNWDDILITYNSTTTVYVFKLATVTVRTITLNYSDATKSVLTEVTQS